MHLAFIELLRCPRQHAESALVASANRQIDRRIMQGTLGCPLCGATFPIRSGIVDLRWDTAAALRDAAPDAPVPNEERVIRLAAQLDLTEGHRLVALCGEYAWIAAPLSVTFDALVLAVNPPAAHEHHIAQHASVLRIDRAIPLSDAALHGAAIDAMEAVRLGADSIVRVLRPNGRLVAPRSVVQPGELVVLAADESEWVAAKSAPVLQLKRATQSFER